MAGEEGFSLGAVLIVKVMATGVIRSMNSKFAGEQLVLNIDPQNVLRVARICECRRDFFELLP